MEQAHSDSVSPALDHLKQGALLKRRWETIGWVYFHKCHTSRKWTAPASGRSCWTPPLSQTPAASEALSDRTCWTLSAASRHSWFPPSVQNKSSLDEQSDVQSLARQTVRETVLLNLLALLAHGLETISDL
jgi:hypothetical protein